MSVKSVSDNNILNDVKNYLDITYDDPDVDKKLTGIIARGMCHLQNIAGGTLDFTQENQAKALLLDYCRYARSNAVEMFNVNFLGELNAMRIEREVAEYEAQNPTSV